ncbi:hypothetical protein JJB09_23515 [Rhizobium sp. KVB221]|uniref:DUF4345 domain-containing protein n=1 Tax=Rhizobium setariae TaxID=2801340 RepID=A0A936YU20_9HYPH|nr:hypothetical protein [Rhizobium setariae]MBL0374987.1 hypothetical protein [Rhizobium setariae]
MEFSLPEFPSAPGAQAAFAAVGFLTVVGLSFLLFPTAVGRFLGLESHEKRPGGIGELRAAGGFLAGLSIATLMFDQPVLYTVVAIGLLLSTFGRVLSLMSDKASTLLNFLLLLVQAVLTAATLYYFFDVFRPDTQMAVPQALDARLVFFTYAGLTLLGALVMFGPRMSMTVSGLGVTAEKASAITTIRSAGGFALGVGLIGLFVSANGENAPMDFLMANLGVAGAFILAVFGRLIALAFNRGNYVYAIVALVVEVVAAAAVVAHISTMM